MKDLRQTPEYVSYLKRIGWKVERVDSTYCFIKKIFPFFFVVKIQRPEKLNLRKIEKLAKKYKFSQIIIEPKTSDILKQLNNNRYRISKRPYLPTKTLYLDLSASKKKLLNQLKKDARYALRKTKDLKLKTENNIEEFRNTWKGAVSWKRYLPPITQLTALSKTFGKAALFLKTEKGTSGAIFLLTDNVALDHQVASSAYYWQAFSSKEGRKSLAQYKIVWEGILWAKARGAKIFDFEGIFDDRFPDESWRGFTHFKKSFGGYEVEYPGAFTKFLLPFKK